MAQQSHILKIPDIPPRRKTTSSPCRKTISIMKFFRNLSSKNTYYFLNLSKEMVIAIILLIFQIFYPSVARAGFFSFMGDKASAKTPEVEYIPNSQNMAILKAVVNVDPQPYSADPRPILASENALVAEIGPAGTASDIDHSMSTEISLYVVRSGDTLSEIAEMFGVSVNTILWANNLSRATALKEGQTLVILPITGIQHVVRKGDTLKAIVAKYKGNLEEVLQYNDLTQNAVLVEGSTIIIPDAEPTTLVASTPSKASASVKSSYYTRPIVGGRKSQGLHGHNGVDLAAPVGTPIYAAAGGTVIASVKNGAWNGGYGNYVIISHPNGTQTLYSHNEVNFVNVGDIVSRGDMIARVGMTGKTTGPHVHFEIRGASNPF